MESILQLAEVFYKLAHKTKEEKNVFRHYGFGIKKEDWADADVNLEDEADEAIEDGSEGHGDEG